MFASNPNKSKIVLKAQCVDCGREATIDIIPTSGGFGLQGGALFKCSFDGYLVKCSDCYHVNPRISSLKDQNKGYIYQYHEGEQVRVDLTKT